MWSSPVVAAGIVYVVTYTNDVLYALNASNISQKVPGFLQKSGT
jgi:outer membrane protein assembly factor BamB